MNTHSIRTSLLPLARKIIVALAKEKNLDEKKVRVIRNQITEKNGGILPRNIELIEAYRQLVRLGKVKEKTELLQIIQKRKVRTLSGIANITVLTKNFGCPGRCIYCPTEEGMPKSYLSSEPAMMRAVLNGFDAYRQVKTRLKGLMAQGHDVSKIDVRVAGGTWSAIPVKYQTEFIAEIFRALNEELESSKSEARITKSEKNPKFKFKNSKKNSDFGFRISDFHLADLMKKNETAKCRCVGLWIETRPDWVTPEEIKKLRRFGVTGVELGVQTTDDKVNEFCQRGHGVEETILATRLLRDAGFKVCYHLMPNLPTATLKSDLKSGRELFSNDGLKPDHLKIYPMVVTAHTELSRMLKKNPKLHTPYTNEELADLLAKIKKGVPEYCRIIRIIRDIPAPDILSGSKISNLRQILENKGVQCRCIRCREIQSSKFEIRNTKLKTQSYPAFSGEEVFITVEEPKLDKIVGLCRLRLPDGSSEPLFGALRKAALVRELHVYGRQETLEKTNRQSKTQHLGVGKQLMAKAEELAKKAGFKKIAVIAAIGTREYYRKLGYRLKESYMIKTLA